MATDRRVKHGIMAALLIAGAFLVALPWIDRPDRNPLPPSFAAGSDAHLRLLSCVKRVDEGCRAGDLQAFRAAVTNSYVESLAQQLRQLDRELDGAALLDMVAGERRTGLLGELQQLQYAGGQGRTNLACMVYDYGVAKGGAQPVFDGFKLLRFRWDGYEFRLDQVRDVRRRAGVDRDELLRATIQFALDH
jgi:hypothetical protein